MKKYILSSLFLLAVSTGFAQSEKMVKAMEAKVAAIDTTRNPAALVELANTFERIAEAEKTQWLPYYYAALAQINSGYMGMNGANAMKGGLTAVVDPIADRAEVLLNKAEALSKDNSEIYVVKKMIAGLRMMGDPMNRYMTFGSQAAEALETAKKLNKENPRIYYLEGQDKFYTPEQFGGSKAEAKKLFELALQKFETFKPENSIAPNWGRGNTQYFLSLASK
ncbi:MAG: hypothetical protein JWP69_1258 [Flaviaesturariibacter sp.]|nr:hypothetical protein [Flaviaesturariibacter sp.]